MILNGQIPLQFEEKNRKARRLEALLILEKHIRQFNRMYKDV